MTLLGYRSSNHPQQVAKRGADDLVDDRGTHPDVFAKLDERFHFTLDVAAAPHNACCDAYYTRADDGLAQCWFGSVWCNPPYSGLSDWLAKAWQEWNADNPHRVVMLLPANRTEQNWWQDHVEPFRDRPGSPLRVEFLKGRMRFIRPGQTAIGPNERPPFGCCLLIWEAS